MLPPPRKYALCGSRSGGLPFQRFLIIFLLLFAAEFLHAQEPDARQKAFMEAVRKGERAKAGAMLEELLRKDTARIYVVAEAAEALLIADSVEGGQAPPEMIRLMEVYRYAERHDPAGKAGWMARKALLSVRGGDAFSVQRPALLESAIAVAPNDCPLVLYRFWIDEMAGRYKGKRLSLQQMAEVWQRAGGYLLVREIVQRGEAGECAMMYQRLAITVRNTIPDCAKLYSRYRDGIMKQRLGPEACMSYLVLAALHNCDPNEVWEKAFAKVSGSKPSAELYRIAAAVAMVREAHADSKKWWNKAIELEKNSALRAAYMLHLARVQALEGDYRGSRRTIKGAMAENRGWGEPYIQLADLYLMGSESCEDFSPFDRKALYWLLIDLCREASNVDASYEGESIRRIYSYEQKAPSRDEAAFRGLRMGDTWPLRCWMNAVTTAK